MVWQLISLSCHGCKSLVYSPRRSMFMSLCRLFCLHSFLVSFPFSLLLSCTDSLFVDLCHCPSSVRRYLLHAPTYKYLAAAPRYGIPLCISHCLCCTCLVAVARSMQSHGSSNRKDFLHYGNINANSDHNSKSILISIGMCVYVYMYMYRCMTVTKIALAEI